MHMKCVATLFGCG